MREDIVKFLMENRTMMKKSDKLVRIAVANQLGGTITSGKYVKLGDKEFLIRKNPENTECGFDVREMNWRHGDEWIYTRKY